MGKGPKGEQQEIVLESRHLLGVFFAVVVLCAFFFSMGYFLGRSQSASQKALSSPPREPAAGSPAPAPSDLTFYERVEGKPPAEKLPAQQPGQPVAPAEQPSPPAAAQTQPIYLQVAAMGQEVEAKRLAAKLQGLGFPAVIRPPRDDRLYRVQVGPFNSTELADAAARRLEAQGFRDLVRR